MKKVTVNPTPTETKTVTPSTSTQTITPSSGKFLSKVTVNAVEDVTTEVNAQPPIVEDIIEALASKAIADINVIAGTKKFSSGTKTYTVNHSFGSVPSYAAIYMLDSTSNNSYFQRIITDNWNATNTQTNASGGLITKTSTAVTFNVYNSGTFSFASDATYLWVIKK